MTDRLDWHKSSTCPNNATCVEVFVSPKTELVGVRDSEDPDAGTLWFTRAEWSVFIDAVKRGEFDV